MASSGTRAASPVPRSRRRFSASRIASQKIPPARTICVSRVDQRMCMKINATSVALKKAIARATTVFQGPRLTKRHRGRRRRHQEKNREDGEVALRRDDVLWEERLPSASGRGVGVQPLGSGEDLEVAQKMPDDEEKEDHAGHGHDHLLPDEAPPEGRQASHASDPCRNASSRRGPPLALTPAGGHLPRWLPWGLVSAQLGIASEKDLRHVRHSAWLSPEPL